MNVYVQSTVSLVCFRHFYKHSHTVVVIILQLGYFHCTLFHNFIHLIHVALVINFNCRSELYFMNIS